MSTIASGIAIRLLPGGAVARIYLRQIHGPISAAFIVTLIFHAIQKLGTG